MDTNSTTTRRTLIIMALILLFVKVVDLEFNQINILGNTAEIQSQFWLHFFYVGSMIYIVLRFYTQSYSFIINQFREDVHSLAIQRILRKFENKYRRENLQKHIKEQGYTGIRDESVTGEYKGDPGPESTVVVKLRGNLFRQDPDQSDTKRTIDKKRYLSTKGEYYTAFHLLSLRVIVSKKYVLELLFPLCLSLASAIAMFVRDYSF